MNKHIARTAANWWADRLMIPEKRELFRDKLQAILELIPDDLDGMLHLGTDYDPQGEILAALHAAGIECRGSFFSCDGILPTKTCMEIWRGTIKAALGGGRFVDLPVFNFEGNNAKA